MRHHSIVFPCLSLSPNIISVWLTNVLWVCFTYNFKEERLIWAHGFGDFLSPSMAGSTVSGPVPLVAYGRAPLTHGGQEAETKSGSGGQIQLSKAYSPVTWLLQLHLT